MAKQVPDSLFASGKHLDSRCVRQNVSDILNITDAYVGMIVYITSEDKYYKVDAVEFTMPTSYSEFNTSSFSAYKPSGSKTISDLTSALLIEGNLGNVYNITDSGSTNEYFVEGSGHPIASGANVVIVDISSTETPNYKFDLVGGFIDLSNYQLQITPSNKLSADLIEDGTTNKVVTQSEKNNWNSKQSALTFDNTPTAGSNNPVTSGGVKTALDAKQDTISDLSTIRSGASAGATAVQIIRVGGSVVSKDANGRVDIPIMQGATALEDGMDGLVPQPSFGEENYVLQGDGGWHPRPVSPYIDSNSGNWVDEDGDTGVHAQGPQGEPGEDGQDGQPGAPGPANTLIIGTVTDGQQAAATITGDAPNQTLNLVLPKGAKGDTGNPGHNPNLGSYTNINDAPTTDIQDGDYIVVLDTTQSPVTGEVYTWNGTSWQSTGKDANSSDFKTGELLASTGIATSIEDVNTGLTRSKDVWRAVRENTFQATDYNEVTFSDSKVTITQGYSLSGNIIQNTSSPYGYYIELTRGSGRELADLNINPYNSLDYVYPLRRIKITANQNNAAVFAFCTHKMGDGVSYMCVDGQRHIINAGDTQIFDIPKGTTRILFSKYTTVDNTPAYIGLMRSVLPCDNLKEYTEKFCGNFQEISNKPFYSSDLLFTSKEIPSGSVVHLTLNITSAGSGSGYIGFYDQQGNRLSYFGRGSVSSGSSTLEDYIAIPTDFYVARIVENVNGVIVSASVSNTDDGNKDYFANYEEIDLSNPYASVSDVYLDKNTLQWVTQGNTGRVYKVIAVPDGKRFVKIKTKPNIATQIVFLSSWETPVNDAFPDFSNENLRLFSKIGEYEIPIPKATKYLAIQVHNKTVDISPIYLGFDAESTPYSESLDIYKSITECGREIESVSCPNAASIVMSTTDANATQYDNSLLGYFNVVKVNEALYYMYYSCIGANETLVDDNSQHLAFAYSTDGVNWTRGIPSNITAPIEGTNLIFMEKVMGAQVFIVQDDAYPFRMLASYNRKKTYMYKSADGVNFQLIREVFPFYCDNQVSCIVRGNIVKVYLRWRSDITGESTSDNTYRWIGVCTIDINGNVICPPTIFFGINLYQASASVLDDRREIAFPTYYNYPVDKQSIQCYIIDGKKVERVLLDTSNLIAQGELSYYVAPSLINIDGKVYLYMSARTTSHNGGSVSRVCRIKRVEVVFKQQGRYWIN